MPYKRLLENQRTDSQYLSSADPANQGHRLLVIPNQRLSIQNLDEYRETGMGWYSFNNTYKNNGAFLGEGSLEKALMECWEPKPFRIDQREEWGEGEKE